MEKDGLKYLIDNTNNLSKPKSKELERLTKRFGKDFKFIVIHRNFVFGYTRLDDTKPISRETYLGTEEEYCKYIGLKYRELIKKQKDESN